MDPEDANDWSWVGVTDSHDTTATVAGYSGTNTRYASSAALSQALSILSNSNTTTVATNATTSPKVKANPVRERGIATATPSSLITYDELLEFGNREFKRFLSNQVRVAYHAPMGSQVALEADRDRHAMEVMEWASEHIKGIWCMDMDVDRLGPKVPKTYCIRFMFERAEDAQAFTQNYVVMKKLSKE